MVSGVPIEPQLLWEEYCQQDNLWIGLLSWLVLASLLSLLFFLLCHQGLIGMGLSFPLAIPVGLMVINVRQRWKRGKPPKARDCIVKYDENFLFLTDYQCLITAAFPT